MLLQVVINDKKEDVERESWKKEEVTGGGGGGRRGGGIKYGKGLKWAYKISPVSHIVSKVEWAENLYCIDNVVKRCIT